MSDFRDSTPQDPYQPPGGQPGPPPPPYGQTPFGQQPPPGPPPGPPGVGPPPNYLPWAILTTLFCCIPLGIVSIVFAAQVNTKYNARDFAGALDASKKAKQFAIAAAIVGAVVIFIYFVALAASTEESARSLSGMVALL